MNEQINITSFNELLNSEYEDDQLMEALRQLAEISDPQSIADAKGPTPLGVWAGWAM